MKDLISELILITGKFKEDLPKEKQYLQKYFKTEIQLQFVKYYLLFKTDVITKDYTQQFIAHTGFDVATRFLIKLKLKLDELIEQREMAKNDFDFEKVALIESGKYKCSHH